MTESDNKIVVQSEGGISLARSHTEVGWKPDSMYPDVFVGELNEDVRSLLADGKVVKGIKLGTDESSTLDIKLTEMMAQDLHRELMRVSDKAYLLIWEGNKVPRGAEISGHKIGWTQNGQVLSDEGKQIGVYDRIMEYGGDQGKTQQMIIFVTKSAV